MKCIKGLVHYSRALVFSFFLLNPNLYAVDSYYVGADLSYAGVSSTQEFTNGSQDQGTGFHIGYKFTEYSFELGYGKYNYINTHFRTEDNIDVSDFIEDTFVSFGVRGQHNEYFESKFGVSINQITGTFTGSDGSEYFSPVDGTFFGIYFGTGPKITFNGDLDIYFDFTLRRISKDIFTVGYDLGARFYF